MGRGDRKTRKGKIFRASYGIVRPKGKVIAKAKRATIKQNAPTQAAPKKKASTKKK